MHFLSRAPSSNSIYDVRSSLMLPNVVNCANIRVIQCRSGFRLAAESLRSLRVFCKFFGQELEGDKTIQPDVLGFVNDSHSTVTQFLNDAIMRNGLVNHSAKSQFYN